MHNMTLTDIGLTPRDEKGKQTIVRVRSWQSDATPGITWFSAECGSFRLAAQKSMAAAISDAVKFFDCIIDPSDPAADTDDVWFPDED